MVWKSNLEEMEHEFIEDFGAKTGEIVQQQPGGVPKARPPKSTGAAGSKLTTAKKGGSPTKSVAPEINHDVIAMGESVNDHGVGGSGEELAQTLEKVVSQLDIISRTLHVLEQRVSMNEESVNSVMGYFLELKEQKAAHQAMSSNIGHSSATGHVIHAANSNFNGLSFN